MWPQRRKADGDGWSSVVFAADRVALADVRRRTGQLPQVRSWHTFARDGRDLDVLKRLKSGGHLGGGTCSLLLGHGEYQLLQTEAPPVSREEMVDALRWRIKDMVEFPVEAAGIDVLPVPTNLAPGRVPQVYVVAASHAVLTPRIRLFQEARVPLAVIDIPELAQRNVAALFETENRALAMLVFGEQGGCLTFTYGGELYVTRHIDESSKELAQAVGGAQDALFERVLVDVQRSLDNFDRSFNAISLSKLLVAPIPGAPAFVDYLKSNLYQPVEALDLAAGLDLASVPSLADVNRQAEAIPAIGAALRQEAAV
jgi:MSHA biogenesis protein MshI